MHVLTLGFARQPSVYPSCSRFPRNEPAAPLIIPPGAREGIHEPLDRHAIIGKCHERTGPLLLSACSALQFLHDAAHQQNSFADKRSCNTHGSSRQIQPWRSAGAHPAQEEARRKQTPNDYERFRMASDAFSAIMITGEFVLPETIVGMIEASTMRNLSIPCTRNFGSTTALGSLPILQVPTG